MTDSNHTKQLTGFLYEYPAAATTLRLLAEEYEERIDIHLVDASDGPLEPLEVGDLIIRHMDNGDPIAVIHSNGKIHRLDEK